ncbi:MAG: 5'-methylthioadenosine/S-adenosylhomocysteine nucleosidase, partial [Treponema sp.]|nr:5'-methylthioadenosine/S-adenosylhomocysteine nucleosidase [Treponema sp.]
MIGIIGAMEEEVAILREGIENRKIETDGVFEFTAGKLEGKDVVLLRGGIGKVNAAAGCVLLIRRYAPALVINTGSAGGIDPSLNFGDAIISEGLIQHDVDVTAFGYAPGQIPHMPAVFTIPEDLVLAAERAVDELKGEGLLPETFNHVRGLIGSGDVFMQEDGRIRNVRELFPSSRAAEMEAAAIAQTCYLFSIPGLFIRA